MTAPVLLLNGPPGIGKTSVAARLAAAHPGTIHIEGDAVRAFAPEDKARHLGPGSTYKAAAALTEVYLAMGARAVIVDFCFLHGGHVRHYRDALPTDVAFDLVTLWAPLAVVEARERRRAEDPTAIRSPLADKVAECWHLMEAHREELGRFIDAASAGADELAALLAFGSGAETRR